MEDQSEQSILIILDTKHGSVTWAGGQKTSKKQFNCCDTCVFLAALGSRPSDKEGKYQKFYDSDRLRFDPVPMYQKMSFLSTCFGFKSMLGSFYSFF